ncbi:MAG: asparagine synthase (glutamine-hydrolyzing) [Deltaproteobacteria bacterium]|nr:asparagine synthase (glutamine-hydrolyzing) [Deltaproteobacteria bacterium]
MCGIAGIYNRALGPVELKGRIQRMTAALEHRGPDDSGIHIEDGIALGHRRLSIIDLETGSQPIFNEDRTMCIVYNGEVFNYRDLKADLMRKGHRFSTNSDTETILHAYEEWGERSVERLRGMFAFCIWDSKKKRLLLARDRFGIKPLFYSLYNGNFIFASEMKSILSDDGFKREIDFDALAGYFNFSYIPAPLSIFRRIRKLLPGHLLVLGREYLQIKEYWNLHYEPDYGKKEEDFISESMEILNESVRMRLVSDVPVGAFLSGGVDSSMVVALTSKSLERVNSFTIGFGGAAKGFDDERKYARLVAEKYCTNHKEYEAEPRLEGLIESIVKAFDEPFADDSTIPSYYISELARKDVKVALSGLGGDEAFCGYERYLGFYISGLYNRVPKILRENIIRKLVETVPADYGGGAGVGRLKRFVRSSSDDGAERYMGFISKLGTRYRGDLFEDKKLFEKSNEAAKSIFLNHFNSRNAEDPLNKVFYCDMKTYLPDDILACTDRLSMHHSLEVRVPFLDHKLIEYSATIPPELKMKRLQKKYLLKKAAYRLLPPEVINHKKQGFVGPLSSWLKKELKGFTEVTLSERNLKRHSIVRPKTVRSILDDHYSGRENNETLIWTLLVFQVWFDTYMGLEPSNGGR